MKGDEQKYLDSEKKTVEVVCKICGYRMFDINLSSTNEEILTIRRLVNNCHRCKRCIYFSRIKKKELLKSPKHVIVNGTHRWRLYF